MIPEPVLKLCFDKENVLHGGFWSGNRFLEDCIGYIRLLRFVLKVCCCLFVHLACVCFPFMLLDLEILLTYY